LAPIHTEGKKRPKKNPDHFRLVGGTFNNQGTLYTRLVSGDHKISRSLYPPARIFGVSIEALMGFSHIYNLDGFKNTLFSQGCIIEAIPSTGTVGRTSIPRTGEELRNLQFPGNGMQVNLWSCPLSDLLQQKHFSKEYIQILYIMSSGKYKLKLQ